MRVPHFEVFSGLPNSKDALWLETIEGLGEACARMKALAASKPGSYFVFHALAHQTLASIDTTPKPKSEAKLAIA